MNTRQLRLGPLAIAGVFFAISAGCAHVEEKPSPGSAFSLSGSGFETTAQVTANGAVGPQIDVGRYDGGKTFRGTAFGRPVDLSASGQSVRGTFGITPFELDVTDSGPKTFRVTGLVAGVPSTFSADPEQIEGTIGHCSYDLRWAGQSYTGTRSCAGGMQSVDLRLPQTISSWSNTDVAVLMALLMPAA